jgi:SagB-type dehydrogenase family enzyme
MQATAARPSFGDREESRSPPDIGARRISVVFDVMAKAVGHLTLREYHERTKHSLASVRAGGHSLDWDNQPVLFKIYPDLQAIPLPTDLPGSQRPVLAALAGAAPSARPVDVDAIAHLLYFSAGVLRTRTHPGGSIFYRAAACTGALYHVDVYVAAGPLPGLAAGLYHFGPHDFALRRLREGDHRGHLRDATGAEPHVAGAPVLMVLTSTFWRNAWKYRTRTYRHSFWDAGTLLANLLAAASALGVPAHVATGFADDGVARLLDVDPAREAPLAIVAIGSDGPPMPAAPPIAPLGYPTLPLSREEVSYPILGDAQAASSLASADVVGVWRTVPEAAPAASPAAEIPLEPLASGAVRQPVEAVVLRRGSARRFSHAPVPLPAFATVLGVAALPPPLDVHAPSSCYAIVHAVEDLASGAYAVTADGRGLDCLRRGEFRREAGFLGLGQTLPADAAACLYWLVDLDAVFARLGDRGYRVAQLEAAIAGGRTYLAAYALGLGATGLTFFDDDVTAFFSPHAAGKSVMFHVAIGRRVERPRR